MTCWPGTRNGRRRGSIRAFPYGISSQQGELTFAYFPGAPIGSTAFPDAAAAGLEKCKEAFLDNFRGLPNTGPILRRLPRSFMAKMVDWGIRKSFQPEEVTCEVRSSSDVIAEQRIESIDLLKVDAEYAEMDVLRGIREEHWPKIRQASIEIHDGRVDEISAILSRHGIREIAVDQLPVLKGSDQFLLSARR